jgi:leader peptidase (prepilin peptidase)/N-methyltransferase
MRREDAETADALVGPEVGAGWASVPWVARLLVCAAAVTALAAAVWPVVPIGAAVGVALLSPAALVDLHARRLPDRLVAGAMIGAITATVGGSGFTGGGTTGVLPDVTSMLAGAAAVALPLLAVHLVSPSGMGFGDVKCGAVLGACIGLVRWELALVALVLAAGLGATAGVVTRARSIAFGAALVVGGALALAGAPLLLQEWTDAGR